MYVCCGSCGNFVCDVSPVSFCAWLASNPDNVLLCWECDPLTDDTPEVLALNENETLVIRSEGKLEVRLCK